MIDSEVNIPELVHSKSKRMSFIGRQLMMTDTPASRLVETYLHTNEGRLQSLDGFPMKRAIYDNMPKKLLLKCSRKTLKSTLLSNMITLNAIRYNRYAQLYVAPQESSAKYFSGSYLSVRMDSPPLRRITQGFLKNDVFEKVMNGSMSTTLLRYASDDATRVRGPATDHNFYDEIQDMDAEILPIIWYTMGMSDFQRECYSGTPLTTDNTIEHLWRQSTQYEWGMKCTCCNHWNFLRLDNDPMKMIQRKGLCCSKCDTKLDTNAGEWIQFNTGADVEIAGYHLAQPILPYFSNNENRWAEIYKNVHLKDYGIAPIHNEIFGLSFDTGSKPITEEQLRSLCNLGPMLLPMPSEGTVPLHKRLAIVQKGKYQRFACGADWGVNMLTSRTAVCIIGIIDEMHFDVVYCEIIKGYEYEAHIRKIAGLANALNAFCASDAGPDPIRGLTLMEATSPTRTQLATYRETQMVQYTSNPGTDYRQARWVLHRSDTLSIVFNVLKGKKVYIRFPRWEDCAECFGDIMNVFVETKQGQYREEMRYSHKPDCPDDFIHALNFGLMQALLCTSNSLLQGQSSTSNNDTIAANV